MVPARERSVPGPRATSSCRGCTARPTSRAWSRWSAATEAGDRVFFTDWRGDADERLTDDGPTVGELLRAAPPGTSRSAALMWRSHPRPAQRRGERAPRPDHQRVRRRGAARRAGAPRRLPPPEAARRAPPQAGPRTTWRSSAASTSATAAATTPRTPGDPQAAPLDDALRRHPAVARRDGGDPRPGGRRTCSTPSPSAGTTRRRSTTATPTALPSGSPRMPRHPEPLPERWDPPPDAGRAPGAGPADLPRQAARVTRSPPTASGRSRAPTRAPSAGPGDWSTSRTSTSGPTSWPPRSPTRSGASPDCT